MINYSHCDRHAHLALLFNKRACGRVEMCNNTDVFTTSIFVRSLFMRNRRLNYRGVYGIYSKKYNLDEPPTFFFAIFSGPSFDCQLSLGNPFDKQRNLILCRVS